VNNTDQDDSGALPETWLQTHGRALHRYALASLRDRQQADDAVQETLLAALAAPVPRDAQGSAGAWLMGILKHKVADQLRRRGREVRLRGPDESAPDERASDEDGIAGVWPEHLIDWRGPEHAAERGERIAELQYCLDQLPERMAELFWQREVMGEDSASVCEALGISTSNLWTMLHRARTRLRHCLEPGQEPEPAASARRTRARPPTPRLRARARVPLESGLESPADQRGSSPHPDGNRGRHAR
jgi:RNA polymerase sigma-70 factor (ECF subfamily)